MYGLNRVEVKGIEHVKESLRETKGILITPNHCHPADPMVMAIALQESGTSPYTVASWHLFKQNWLQSFVLPRVGVFSIYREGLDREALKCMTDILGQKTYNNRPLLMFPEGIITRTNDHLGNFMEGLALVARMAAKQRGDNNVVIIPTAIRYKFKGDLEKTIDPILDNLEHRLSWRVNKNEPYYKRISNIAFALLCLKEIEYYGDTGVGDVNTRVQTLIDTILGNHEEKWLKSKRAGDTTARVKTLRTAVLPDLIKLELSEDDRKSRWKTLEDAYLAQQLANYDASYFNPNATKDQILEAVQKFEEDLTDKVAPAGPLNATVTFCAPIPISSDRSEDKSGTLLTSKVKEEVSKALGL
jgi:1-acyl-sn-glycerol-3-phosphate acyltransferase